jgi:hypothetical protein
MSEMSGNRSEFSAAHSAAGYLYQARLALAECLRYAYADSGIEIAIEKLDDVSFEKEGSAIELLQTKHHLHRSGDLTDTSVDLWKTLRVWAEATKEDPSLPGRTRFALITTAQAPEGCAASYLRPNTNHCVTRDIDKAESVLMAAAASSRNTALEKAFAAFTSLSPAIRKALLGAIEVLDRAPLIAELENVIENRLRMIAPRGKAAVARELIEGWWWPKICATLQMDDVGTISIIEVEQKLDDIRESLKRDALPLDMEHVEPPESDLHALEEMQFIRQLRAVGVGVNRLQYAKRDYYRAFTQRSRWSRQNLLFDGEVSKFEMTLIEEWEPRFSRMCDGLKADCDEGTAMRAGQDLYHWVEAEARFPFRTVASRFLNVGSYHMLSNDLRLGWHPNYATLLVDEEESEAGHGS